MFKEKLSEIKKQLEFISNPLAWCVNIGSAVVSWKYWDGINMSAETTTDAGVTIGALILMTVASAWIFVDGDEKVRRYFKREGVSPLFASDKDLEDINNDRVKTWLKTHYSLDKYDKACSLAITWVFTLLAIALVKPSPDTSSYFCVQYLPKVGLCLSVAICVLVHWFRHKIRKEEDDKWFTLSGDFPIIKDLPGFKSDYIMCKSPKPLIQWGSQDRYVIKTSMVNSSRMPGKDSQDRKDVRWRLLQLSE